MTYKTIDTYKKIEDLIVHKNYEMLKETLKENPDISYNNYEVLCYAYNDVKALKILIPKNLDLTGNESEVLRKAISYENNDVVEFLLDKVKFNQQTINEAFIESVITNNKKLIEMMLEAGVNVSTRGHIAIVRCAINDLLETAQLLVEHGADVDVLKKHAIGNIKNWLDKKQLVENLDNSLNNVVRSQSKSKI